MMPAAGCRHTELWSGGGIRVEARRCDYGTEVWTDRLESAVFGLLLPIIGAYRLRTDGVTQFVERGCGCFRRPGEEVVGSGISRAHVSTALYVDVDRFDAVDGGDWPSGELFVGARLDLLHRLLRRELRTGLDPGGVEMRVVELIGAAIDIDGAPARRPPGATARHRQITADVLEALAHADGSFSLIELSHTVACSPFHLSRIFHHSTGVTLRQYRARARLAAALDLLEQGVRDLSLIAATCGFADHSHLTRTATAQLGASPSRLRELLCDPSSSGRGVDRVANRFERQGHRPALIVPSPSTTRACGGLAQSLFASLADRSQDRTPRARGDPNGSADEFGPHPASHPPQ